jgi:hypothetical protein
MLGALSVTGCSRAELPVATDPVPPAEPSAPALEYGPNGELLNQGTLCLFRGEPDDRNAVARAMRDTTALELANGEDLVVGVSPIRLSGCVRMTSHDCSVEREGDGLRVTSSLATKEPEGPCIAEGGGAGKQAFCRLPALTSGHYTLHWGTRDLTFDVPGKLVKQGRCLYEQPLRATSSR